jgi:hypothetical protein
MLWVLVGMVGGHRFYPVLEGAGKGIVSASKNPSVAEPFPSPVAAFFDTSEKREPPVPPPPPPPPPPKEATSDFYPGESAPLPLWVRIVLPLAVGTAVLAGVLAAVFAARRPQAIEDDDTEVFTKALHHWAVAAYEVGQSPREMKRFLNRLRFAAAGRAVDLRDDILVGLGVLEHAGALPELMDTVPNGATALHAAIDARGNSSPAFARISEALYPDALARSGLPCFEPTPAQVQTFLALWEGVKVEA